MIGRMAGALRRICALMLSVFMILSQFALPAGALAQDLSVLPMVNLYYTEGEETLSVTVSPSLYGTEAVYWATVPQSAFASGVTLEIFPGADESVTYNSTSGYQLFPWDASAVDGNAATWIEVYHDGAYQLSAPLYLSSVMMPQPEVQQPVPAFIRVVYCDSATGAELYSEGAEYGAGEHAFTPNPAYLPENYELDSTGTQYVTVYEDGTASQSEVVFFATEKKAEPVPATITVIYSDSQTGAQLYMENAVYYAGEHAFAPNASYLPENYVLDDESTRYVTVYEDGTASQYEVVFFATYQEPEPQPAIITVVYSDSQTGEALYSYSDVYDAGEHSIAPDASLLPENYTLDSENAQYVTVYEDGTASQYEVVFFATYQKPEPQPATITVIYYAQTGEALHSYSDVYYAGEHTFAPDASLLPENYALESFEPVYVTVYEDGTASQYEVAFFASFQQPEMEPVPAVITVIYADSRTSETLFSSGDVYYAGDHTFAPDASLLPEGYVLESVEPVYVTVYEDGTASQYEVVFFASYQQPEEPEEPIEPEAPVEPEQPQEPVEVEVHVYYVGADGFPVWEESHTFGEGSHVIRAQELEGYVFNTDQQLEYTVEVDAQGGVSMPIVMFYVTKLEAPVEPEQPQEPSEPEQPQEPEQPEQPAEPEQPQQPEQPGLPEGTTLLETLNCQGKTTGKGLNIRKGPSTEHKSIGKISVTGTVIDVYASVLNNTGDLWYQIHHEGTQGFVLGTYVELIPSEPVRADVTIRYTADGSDIPGHAAQVVTLEEGTHPVNPFITAIDGYTFVSASAEMIVVDQNGANPAEVVLAYERNPVNAPVVFRYVDQNGTPVADNYETVLGEGSYAAADYQRSIEGYQLLSVSVQTINVGASGADVSEVVFTYERLPVTAEIILHFVDESGNPIADSLSRTLGENSYAMAEHQLAIPGYTFQHVNPETVTVGASGADAKDVIFTYRRDPVTAEINFHFVDEAGQAIAPAAVNPMGEGSWQMAEYYQTIEGYTFQYVQPETVTIGASGADAQDVNFVYKKDEVTAQVTFLYADDQGSAIPGLSSRTETLGEGTWDTAAYALTAPKGYLYSGASAQQITVTREGATPAEVLFTYTRLPDAVALPVYYLDADRQPLMESRTITFTARDFGKTFDSAEYALPAPEGYEYAGVSSETITVDERGGIAPQALEFTYTLKPKAKATVTFEYLSTDGRKVADLLTTELAEGVYDVMEYAAKPEKYNFKEVSSQTVTITSDGRAEPAVITFTYEPVKDKATLRVHYRTAIGEDFAGSPEIRELPVGTYTITPTKEFEPAGSYALSASTQSYTVTVGSDLVAQPASVYFTYYDASVTADVTVRYQDSVNGSVIAEEVRKLTPGTHQLEPDEALVASKGRYVRSSYVTNTSVTVDESGKANYNTVIFYYEPEETENYLGYLLVTQQTSLRSQPAASGEAKAVLPADTVILTNGQQLSGATEWYSSVVQTGSAAGKLGWVNGDHVRRISSEEAAARMEEEKQDKEPEQNPGLYITLMDGVPLRRYMSTASEAKYLKINVVVTVSGQEYDENGYLWHRTRYDGVDGYVRDGQLRKLTADEVDDYIADGGDTSTGTPDQYDPNGASSYGYITSDSVNFRTAPGGNRIKMLNKYAMALIVGTREINGVTWYNVNYSGTVGWVHGDYFHQMSLTEFTSFMGSKEYYQGITNNTVAPGTSGSASSGSASTGSSTGSATQGNVSSVEDWNVGAWQNTGVTTQSTYQPFNPYATPAATAVPNGTYTTGAETKFYQSANTNSGSVTLPKGAEIQITGTVMLSSTKWYAVTYDGKTGYVRADDLGSVSATPTPAPTSTFVIGTMIPINYEDESKETQTGSVPWGLIGAAVVLVGGAGGVYAYALNQNKRRKMAAARAAASRRAQAAAAGGTVSPYARRAVAAPNAAQGPQAQQSAQPSAQMRNPYSTGSITGNASPYAKPEGGQQTPGAFGAAGAAGAAMAGQQKESNPYRPSQSNPYAAPVEVPPIVNPYAAPRAESEAPAPSAPVSTNPYARPIGTMAPAAREGAEAENAVRRRATRMQRYHAAGEGEENKE